MAKSFKLTRGILATNSLESDLCYFGYVFPFHVIISTRPMENKGWEQCLNGKERVSKRHPNLYMDLLSDPDKVVLFWIISNMSWFNPIGQLGPKAAWSSSSSCMGERIRRVKASKLMGGSKDSLIGKAKSASQAK